jgi:hypothetical protein
MPNWSIASWNCCQSGTVTNSTPVAVKAGDTINGTMTGTDCSSGVCSSWEILTQDATSGMGTTLKTSALGQTFGWVLGGVLESYSVSACTQFPASGNVTFTQISGTDITGKAIPNTFTSKIWAKTPACGYKVQDSGNSVEIELTP